MRGLAVGVAVALASLTGASSPAFARSSAGPDCFDVAVIAQPAEQRLLPSPLTDGGEILLDPLWRMRFRVEQNLSPGRLPRYIAVNQFAHTRLGPQIKHVLLLLKRDGRDLRIVSLDYQFIRDRDGRFFRPVAAPLGESYLAPKGFIPRQYETMLEPVRYAVRDAWWLQLYPDETPPRFEAYPWGRVVGRSVVASRGLYATDLITAIEDRRCRFG